MSLKWKRIDRETIELKLGHIHYRIQVTGENASAKPMQWGLYKSTDGKVFSEMRSKSGKLYPDGLHMCFEKQLLAKQYRVPNAAGRVGPTRRS